MTQEQKIIRAKVGLLELAKQLGNVSQACKMMGYGRDSFYRFKALDAKAAQEGILLTAAQIAALEKAKADKEAHGEFESECPGLLRGAGHLLRWHTEGVGRIYQQTVIDTYAKVAFAKLYDRKTP